MKLHVLQHVWFEDEANIGCWAAGHGGVVTRTRLYDDEPLPDVGAIDGLAIMGGPMNVYQERDYPWLVREKRFIEQAISRGIAVVGVCLGGQLIADVLGAKISRNPDVEIGWFDVRLPSDARESVLFQHLPGYFRAFHWHGDTFDIPAGARRLAASDACANQAFEYGGHVLGLQFHLEYSAESIEKMLVHCGDELVQGPFIQNQEQIKGGFSNIETTRSLLFSLLGPLFNHEK